MKRPILTVSLGVLTLVGTAWVFANPTGKFGISQYGVTTFNRIPLPGLDLQVRPDGSMRCVGKSHNIDAQRLVWLETSTPEVIVVGLGWSSGARMPVAMPQALGSKIIAVPTGEALALYNRLRNQGVRVAIHVHSTC